MHERSLSAPFRHRHVQPGSLAWVECSRAPSRMRSSASTPVASRSRPTFRAPSRPSRSSVSPTALARRRRSACGAESRRPSSNGRCGGSPSISLRPACGRRGPGSISRSRCRSSPPRGRFRGSASPSMRPWASSRWTDGSVRSGVFSLSRRQRGRQGCRASCVLRGRPQRRPWRESSRCRCGISPMRRRTFAASASRSRGSRKTVIRPRSRSRISRTCEVRNGLGGRSRSRPRAGTTSCSPGLRAPARRCSRGGCPRSCLRSPLPRLSRSRGSTRSPGCSAPTVR